MSNELDVVRTCALLHDIGKLECWAKRKPWSEHAFYTYKLVKDCLGEEIAAHAMRHHTGPYYPDEYRPKTDIERIICLADNIASGADRPEEPVSGSFIPSPPIELTHVLSKDYVRRRLDSADLAFLSQKIASELGNLQEAFAEDSRAVYNKLFSILDNSDLRFVPADTRKPINDVSLWDHLKLTAAFATCIYLGGGWKGDNPANYRFALLSGDADRISSFINESLRLPDLNARSRLIQDATAVAYRSLCSSLGPECVLFAGGGSFLALAPPNLADAALKDAKSGFESATEGRVSMTVSHVVFGGDEFQKDFGKIWEACRRQMRLAKGRRILIPKIAIDEGAEVCDVCRKDHWVREDELKILAVDAAPRRERLCEFCWLLREKGKGIWLNDLKDESNFVACIRADGDDIGKVLAGKVFKEEGKASTPSRVSTLSGTIHRVCEVEFREIVERFGGKCVFAGGDDLLAFVPGRAALEASRAIAAKFSEMMAGKCTMSAGVSIFHYRLPVYVGVESAGVLLSKAKQEGKNRVAYAVIGGSGVTGSELEKVKSWEWDKLDIILRIVESMRRSDIASTQLRRVARIAAVNPVRAEAYIEHLMGKEVIDWKEGERLLSYLESGLLSEAFLFYNLFRGD